MYIVLAFPLMKNLSFKRHIDFIKMKISRSLVILRKLKYTFPGSILKILFHCLIQSYVSLCPMVWILTFPSLLKPLSKVHNKAKNLIKETNRSGVIRFLFLSYCIIFCVNFLLFLGFMVTFPIPLVFRFFRLQSE